MSNDEHMELVCELEGKDITLEHTREEEKRDKSCRLIYNYYIPSLHKSGVSINPLGRIKSYKKNTDIAGWKILNVHEDPMDAELFEARLQVNMGFNGFKWQHSKYRSYAKKS